MKIDIDPVLFGKIQHRYWQVQTGIAMLEPLKDSMTTSEFREIIGAEHSVDIQNYSKEMNCVDRGEWRGRKSVTLERNALPGEVCNGCPALYHCILRIIKDDPAFLQQYIPDEIAKKMIIWWIFAW